MADGHRTHEVGLGYTQMVGLGCTQAGQGGAPPALDINSSYRGQAMTDVRVLVARCWVSTRGAAAPARAALSRVQWRWKVFTASHGLRISSVARGTVQATRSKG